MINMYYIITRRGRFVVVAAGGCFCRCHIDQSIRLSTLFFGGPGIDPPNLTFLTHLF
jgi:hypothetical protein